MRRIGIGVVCLALISGIATAQSVGVNVNMVACTPGPNNQPCPWPKGDPFLERQNESTFAVSSRNSAVLVGGSNDYRTVDIPGLLGIDEIGDVWVGLFKSSDNGSTWRSTLLPGYPLDNSPEGLASPVHGFQASADPTVRAGTHGLFYYSFIAFNRDPKNPLGALAVARLIDNNNKENFDPNKPGSDPVQYLSTSVVDTGNRGQFLDKPWIVADIPRAGAGTCKVNGKSFAVGPVYLTYSVFTGSDAKPVSQIMLSKSLDCGATWSKPNKLSEGNNKVQGTSIALDPRNGNVYVVWRRSATSSQPDAILIAKSTDGGTTFSKAFEVQTFVPDDITVAGRKSLFDQPKISVNGIAYSFRGKAFPSVTVDGAGRVYVAWSQRGLIPAAPLAARIVVATSDGTNWTGPNASQVLVDPNTSPSGYYQGPYYGVGGHQFMPALSFANGVVALAYYDSRDDHTVGNWQCLNPSTGNPDPALSCPVSQRVEVRVPVGNLAPPATPGAVFTDYIADLGLGGTLKRRHTIDVRTAQALAGPVPSFASSVRVSQYKFGSRPGSNVIEQLQVNPPNFPMFVRGTASFIGDYLDLTTQAFVSDANGNWSFNTSTSDQPVFHVTWTDNRDVRPPANGNWANFTPVVSSGDSPAGTQGGTSLFGDPSNPNRPFCVQGQSGVRNQNIYASRITPGLVLTSRGNSKQLGGGFGRAFTVVVQNTTTQCKSFRLTLPAPSANTTASFLQLFAGAPPLLTLDVTVAPRSSVAREVFVQSSLQKPNIKTVATELPTNGNCAPTNLSSLQPAANALSTSLTYNADISNADISNADISNADISNADIARTETYFPSLSNADISNADISNADITNADISNADISNADISNADIANADITNADISNADISNADISNADISNADISSATGDVTWNLTNRGNTSASFNTKLFLKGLVNKCVPQNCGTPGQPACTAGCVKFQLIVYKRYKTPVSSANGGCTLMSQFQNQIVTNVIDPTFLTTGSSLTNADITNADISNATVALAPGEDAEVTVRIFQGGGSGSGVHQPIREAASFARIAEALAASVAGNGNTDTGFTTAGNAQAVGTDDAANGITIPSTTLTVVTTALPDAVTGQPYSAAIDAVGGNIGTNNLTWSLLSPLPTGLQLNTGAAVNPVRAKGLISGSPAAASINGTSFNVQVQDAPNVIPPPQQTATQTLSIRIGDPLAIQPTALADATANAPVTVQFTSTGGLGAVTWSPVSLPAWATLTPAGLLTGTPPLSGTVTIAVRATDSSCLVSVTACQHQIANASLSLKVLPRVTSTAVTFSKNPIVVNETVTATATVTDLDIGTKTGPAGTITFGNGATCTLVGGSTTSTCSVSLVFPAAGPQTISANYPGNLLHAASAGNAPLTVNRRATTIVLALAAASVAAGQPVNATVTVTDTDVPLKLNPAGTIALASTAAGDTFTPCVLAPTATLGVSSCTGTVTANSSGTRTVSANFAATSVHAASGPATASLLAKYAIALSVSATPNPAVPLQTITASFTAVYSAPVAPTGVIAIADSDGNSCNAPAGASGNCTFAVSSTGSKTVTATYAGDANFLPAQATKAETVQPYAFTGFLAPLGAAGTFSGAVNQFSMVAVKWQLKDAANAFFTPLATTKQINAVFTGAPVGGVCIVSTSGTPILLYSPTAGPAGASTFTYDTAANAFVFNWDTNVMGTTTGCVTVSVQLADGTTESTSVNLRRL